MLDALRFVASAVARKDYVPELTHFRIQGERITGYNGVVALSSPISVDLDVFPLATKFLAAVRACKETIALSVTPAGKLAVRSGAFRSYVDCLAEGNSAALFVEPEGEEIELGDQFLPGIRQLAPLMGIDASRPWSAGIMLSGTSMYATNNTMLAEYWSGDTFPIDAIIPAPAVEELLRINARPIKAQLTERSLSLWFEGDRWLRTQLLEGSQWPHEHVKRILDFQDAPTEKFTPGFFEAVETLKPFLGDSGTVFMTPQGVSTAQHEGEGTAIELALPVAEIQAYHQKNLLLLGQVATEIDWSTYPRPCRFFGGRLRGAIVGQRVG